MEIFALAGVLAFIEALLSGLRAEKTQEKRHGN